MRPNWWHGVTAPVPFSHPRHALSNAYYIPQSIITQRRELIFILVVLACGYLFTIMASPSVAFSAPAQQRLAGFGSGQLAVFKFQLALNPKTISRLPKAAPGLRIVACPRIGRPDSKNELVGEISFLQQARLLTDLKRRSRCAGNDVICECRARVEGRY